MWHIPTRGRPERLRSLIAAMKAHGSVEPAVVWTNFDDSSYDEYMKIELPQGWHFYQMEEGVRGCAAKLRRAFELHPNDSWYGFMADDIGIETDGFEQTLIGAAGLWGIASGNDMARARENVMEGRLNGASVFGGGLLRALGYWVPPDFIQLYIDDVWETIGRSLGNWRTLMDVATTHSFKQYIDTSKMDATCASMNSPAMYETGKQIFEKWTVDAAADDIDRARAAIAETISGRSVMLGTPCYADVSPHYAAALFETGMLLRNFGVICEPKMIGGLATHVGRNAIAEVFMASEHTDLIFIDADMSWSPWDVIRLLASRQALIGGVGHKRSAKIREGASPWCFKPLPDAAAVPDAMGNIEVSAIGMGMTLIHRSVFQYIAKGRPDLQRVGESGQPYWRFFAWGDENGAELSEDYEFCRRWRAIGGKVWVDASIKLGHYGQHDFGARLPHDIFKRAG
jgi:hypothetical protein